MRHSVVADGQVVALHEKVLEDNQKRIDKTAYMHRDIQNSTNLVTDNKGNIITRVEYDPYGSKIEDTRERDTFKSDRLRGYTNHKSIEGTNLIDMKARLYDPALARFVSTDSIVPDSNRVVGYNRYAYVYNNPVNYIDPDGHDPLTLFVIGSAIFSVGATTDASWGKVAMVVGSVMMGRADLAGASAAANGAVVGATTGFINSGGELDQAIKSGVISAASAGVANEIGHGSLQEVVGDGIGRYIAHGVSQGVIAQLRGGSFRSGFISGVIGHAGGGAVQALKISDPVAQASIIGIFGGLSSKATGGEFYDGAMQAAFVHLFRVW
jgi:RHS repeat-associated protein